MLFRDPSKASIYVNECIKRPARFLGINAESDTETFLKVLGEANEEAINVAGSWLGTEIGRKVLTDCIRIYEKNMKDRHLDKALDATYKDIGAKLAPLLRVIDSRGLDKIRIGNESLKSFEYLASGRESNVILESELNVGIPIRNYRFEVLSDVPASYLWKMFLSDIETILGVTLNPNQA